MCERLSVFDQEYAQTLDNHIYRRWNRAATEVPPSARSRIPSRSLTASQTIPSIVSGRSMREENDKGVTLAECLRMFVTPEKLSKDDPWYAIFLNRLSSSVPLSVTCVSLLCEWSA